MSNLGTSVLRIQESDSRNFSISYSLLSKHHPDALRALDAGAALLEQVGDLFGLHSNYDSLNQEAGLWLAQLPEDSADHLHYFQSYTNPPDAPPGLDAARNAYRLACSAVARSLLLLRLRRDFPTGACDILALKLTPALGLLRLQVETVGLMHLIVANPALGMAWINAITPDGGRSFYRDNQTALNAKLRDLDLYSYYDQGSHLSLHSRISALAPGALIPSDDDPGTISLSRQEIANGYDLVFWMAHYLRAQQRVLAALQPGLAEVPTGEWPASPFSDLVASLCEAVRVLHDERENREAKPDD